MIFVSAYFRKMAIITLLFFIAPLMLSYVFFQDQGILVMFFAAMNLGIYVGVKSFGLVYFILVAFSALMIVAGFFVEKTSGVVIYILGILLYVILGLVGAGLMY